MRTLATKSNLPDLQDSPKPHRWRERKALESQVLEASESEVEKAPGGEVGILDAAPIFFQEWDGKPAASLTVLLQGDVTF